MNLRMICRLLALCVISTCSLPNSLTAAELWQQRGQANMLLFQQRFDEAFEILEKHPGLADNDYDRGECDFQLGLAYSFMGDFRRAVNYYRDGLDRITEEGYRRHGGYLAASHPFALHLAGHRHKLAYALIQSGRLKAAEKTLRENLASLEAFRAKSANPAHRNAALQSLSQSTNTLGKLLLRQGRSDEARPVFVQLVALTEAMEEVQQQAAQFGTSGLCTVLFERSQGLYHLGRHAEARVAMEKCLEEARRTFGDAAGRTIIEIYYHTHMASVLQALGEPDAAIESGQRALEVAAAYAPHAWGHPEAAMELAELCRSQQRWELAEKCYREAAAAIENIYREMHSSAQRRGYLDDKLDVYPRLASLLAGQGRWEAAFQAAEAGRSRALLDSVGNAPLQPRRKSLLSPELQTEDARMTQQLSGLVKQLQGARWNPQADVPALRRQLESARREYARFQHEVAVQHPGYAVFRSIQTESVESLRGLFAEHDGLQGTALLMYLISDQQIFGWCFDGQQLHGRLLSDNAALVREQIQRLRTDIAGRSRNWQESARGLDAVLVQPFADELKGQDRVLLLPHQELCGLPFAVLTNSSGRTLLERHALAVLPSTSILRLWLAGTEDHPDTARKTLVVANPDGSLPHTEREAEVFARTFPGAHSLLGAAAQETRFYQLAAESGLLHVATHGVVNPSRPEYSHLVLAAPDAAADGDGLLDVHEIVRKVDARDARLVVLSACQSAIGPQSRGAEVQSLANAFLFAGAHSVVASLWAVDDAATADLMGGFYASKQCMVQPAAALRAAMLDALEQGRHPYEWAAFQVIGLR